ncbi:MAG TPA: aspartate/glutamate racemase family protein [Microvirga sp.]|nr:aspartate/glutamate racemase family protein [Microvirga sp.]
MIVRGGRAIYGETVGILVLDTKFPRIPGDVANATTFGFPVRYKVVDAAGPDQIVAEADRARAFLPAFIDAARLLEREGVRAITTTCGFLIVMQEEIAAAVGVPVITSSLSLIPLVRQMIGPRRSIGVITADAGHLSERHLAAAGVRPEWPVHVRGMEQSPSFSQAILGRGGDQRFLLDVEQVTSEVIAVCKALALDDPDLGCLVFECTNLQPYAVAVQAELGLPIFGIYHIVNLLHSGVMNPRLSGYL